MNGLQRFISGGLRVDMRYLGTCKVGQKWRVLGRSIGLVGDTKWTY